jgi:glycosyltransferase involved in cell wall biosynthesis
MPAQTTASDARDGLARVGLPRPVRVLELRSVRGTGGGPEKTILQGAARTDPARIAITVCYLRDARDDVFDIDRRAAAAGVDYVEIREQSSMDRSIWPALRQLVRDRRIDIVHAHEYKTDLLAYLLARAEGITPLATVHGWSGDSWREQRIYYPIDLKLLFRFPRVVAVSKAVRTRLLDAGVRSNRIDVILNGIDEGVFRRDPVRSAAARARFGLGSGDFAIGGVGRLETLKRFDLLIDAVAALRTRYPRIRLLLAGEGSARADLEARSAACGLSGTCTFVGQCADVVEFHHALDLFVQSSATEASPNVILEAMALETPIVATDVGGTTELMRPGTDGIAVAELSSDAIAAAIEEVLRDVPAARTRSVEARQRVERELSFAARMSTIDRVYESLATARLESRRA